MWVAFRSIVHYVQKWNFFIFYQFYDNCSKLISCKSIITFLRFFLSHFLIRKEFTDQNLTIVLRMVNQSNQVLPLILFTFSILMKLMRKVIFIYLWWYYISPLSIITQFHISWKLGISLFSWYGCILSNVFIYLKIERNLFEIKVSVPCYVYITKLNGNEKWRIVVFQIEICYCYIYNCVENY